MDIYIGADYIPHLTLLKSISISTHTWILKKSFKNNSTNILTSLSSELLFSKT